MQIKETMLRYGFTPATLAKKMGVFDSTVSRLVSGNPTVQKLDDLARQIGCQRWEFFLDEIRAAGMRVERASEELRVKSEEFATAAGAGARQGEQGASGDADTQGSRILCEQSDQGRAANPSERESDAGAAMGAPHTEQAAGAQGVAADVLQQAIICPHCQRAISIKVG